MQIRIRTTGAVMYESEFRAYTKANGGPSWETTTTEVLEALGADVVFEGAQATGGTVYQYSQANGVEQVDGKWYTKYILGPVFIDQVVDGVTTTAAVGTDLKVYGDVTISGNLTLDAVGPNDVQIAGSINIANTLNATTIGANTAFFDTANVTSLVGSANTAIYSTINSADDRALAYSIIFSQIKTEDLNG